MGWASAVSWLRHAHGVLGCNIIEMVDVVFCLVQAGDAVFREALRLGCFILLSHQPCVY